MPIIQLTVSLCIFSNVTSLGPLRPASTSMFDILGLQSHSNTGPSVNRNYRYISVALAHIALPVLHWQFLKHIIKQQTGNFRVYVSVSKNTTRVKLRKKYDDTGIRTNIFQLRRTLVSWLNVLFLFCCFSVLCLYTLNTNIIPTNVCILDRHILRQRYPVTKSPWWWYRRIETCRCI
jgi:hypothetical protein